MSMSQESEGYSDRVKLAAGAVAAWFLLDLQVPDWWLLAGVALAGGGLAAYLAAGRIMDMLEDPRPVRLIQINATGDPVAAWSLSEDLFAETEIHHGPLVPHGDGTTFETYECYAYNEGTNAAVGTWRRHSVPGSEMVGQYAVEDLERSLEQLRGHLEPMARRGDALRTHLPGIVRQLDYERAQALNAALEQSHPEDVTRRGIDEVVRDELPADCHPDAVRNGDLATLAEDTEDEEDWSGEGMELVVPADEPDDALEPALEGEVTNGHAE